MSNIAARIKCQLAESASRDWVFFGQETIKGSALLAKIEEFEKELKSFENHDCIAINLETSPTALAYFIASLSVAKNTAYLDTSWPEEHRENTLDSIGANLLVIDNQETNSPPFEQRPLIVARDKHASPIPTSQLNHVPKYTCFTSGSTGAPKGCVRSEASWIASFEADQSFAKISENNVVVVLGSFAHSLGLYAAVRGLYAGAKVMLFHRFDALKITRHLQSVPETILFGVPAQFVSLARAAQQPNKAVNRLLTTGAKISETHAKTIQHAFPNADIIEFYGTSELSYVSARKISANEAPTSVGKPLEGVQIAVKESDTVEISTNASLIQVRSQMAFDGYIIDGKFLPAQDWISVGDTGFMDEGGSLHLVGRVDRMFQSSGRNIVPEAIEASLLDIGGIKNAAAFGVADELRENRIVSVIETDQTVSRKLLVDSLKARIAAYTIPHKFYICEKWPRTAAGKTDFRMLMDQVSASALDELS